MAVKVRLTPEQLVGSAHVDPRAVEVEASEWLDAEIDAASDARTTADPNAAVVRWARGLARRELGRLDEARADLVDARRQAAAIDDPRLAGRIAVSLAVVEMNLGRPAEARELLDMAEPALDGADLGRLRMQRGLLHHRAGDLAEAVSHYHGALSLLAAGGDHLAESRLHLNLGLLLVQLGRPAEGRPHLRAAHQQAKELGQRLLSAMAMHNLGYLEARMGSVADALEALDEAEREFGELDDPMHVALVMTDRCLVLMQVGLLAEARRDAVAAFTAIKAGGNLTDLADAALVAAQALLADDDPVACHEMARSAAELFRANQRLPWVPLAELLVLRSDQGEVDALGFAERAERIAGTLRAAGWATEAQSASVIAGRRYIEQDELDRARGAIDAATQRGRHVPAVDRIAEHLAHAMLHEASGDARRARLAVNAGIRTFRDNQAALGALELRAHAAMHGEALAELGARLAVRDRRPRELLRRIEAARGVTATLPRARPPGDDELAAALTELRTLAEASHAAAGAGETNRDLERRRAEVESRIRAQMRRSRAETAFARLSVDQAIQHLGESVVLEYAWLGSELWAVSVASGRVALHELGSIERVAEDIDALEFALNRLNRVQGSAASRDAARSVVQDVGARLAEILIPSRVDREAPLVIVPTGRLHGLPWLALTTLTGRPVTIAPSLLAHVHTRLTRATRRVEHVAIVGGPDLAAVPAELRALRRVHAGATVLTPETATVERCLSVLGRSSLAHLACHGSFRADSPLFSTLRVADGDLTVYDLERCPQLPLTVVVSACNAAQSAVLRGGALLGLSSALLQLGVSTVVAPLTPVSDERSVALMTRLHQQLRAGAGPAEALARAAVVDGELDATAAAFVVMGA